MSSNDNKGTIQHGNAHCRCQPHNTSCARNVDLQAAEVFLNTGYKDKRDSGPQVAQVVLNTEQLRMSVTNGSRTHSLKEASRSR